MNRNRLASIVGEMLNSADLLGKAMTDIATSNSDTTDRDNAIVLDEQTMRYIMSDVATALKLIYQACTAFVRCSV